MRSSYLWQGASQQRIVNGDVDRYKGEERCRALFCHLRSMVTAVVSVQLWCSLERCIRAHAQHLQAAGSSLRSLSLHPGLRGPGLWGQRGSAGQSHVYPVFLARAPRSAPGSCKAQIWRRRPACPTGRWRATASTEVIWRAPFVLDANERAVSILAGSARWLAGFFSPLCGRHRAKPAGVNCHHR